MAQETMVKTRAGRCPTHGDVEARKEVPKFRAPGLFWAFQYVASMVRPYRCPQCGEKAA